MIIFQHLGAVLRGRLLRLLRAAGVARLGVDGAAVQVVGARGKHGVNVACSEPILSRYRKKEMTMKLGYSLGSAKVTKPNPLERPVSAFFMTTQSMTSPKRVK